MSGIAWLTSGPGGFGAATGDRYVKMAFQQKGASEKRELRVRAPKLAQAVPGIYMLFVTDKNGVPSLGRRLDLGG